MNLKLDIGTVFSGLVVTLITIVGYFLRTKFSGYDRDISDLYRLSTLNSERIATLEGINKGEQTHNHREHT